MLTQFHTQKPTSISHARALTLKSLGEETASPEFTSIAIAMDNDPDYDLNPTDGLVIHSAAEFGTEFDFALSYEPETNKLKNLDIMPRPDGDPLPFDSFSYKEEDGVKNYTFKINGQREMVEHDTKRDVITTQL